MHCGLLQDISILAVSFKGWTINCICSRWHFSFPWGYLSLGCGGLWRSKVSEAFAQLKDVAASISLLKS